MLRAPIFALEIKQQMYNNLKRKNMNTIITAATLFTMFFNSAKTTIAGSDYYYNADIHDNQVCMLDVYQQDDFKMLSRKMEYRFTYDDQNRLVSKEAYKWDPFMMEWSHYYRMNFSYTDDGYAIEVSDWNYMTKTYDAVKEIRLSYRRRRHCIGKQLQMEFTAQRLRLHWHNQNQDSHCWQDSANGG